MLKTLVKSVGQFGAYLEANIANYSKQLRHAPWKEYGYPEQHSPDFRPDLKNEFSINDCIYPFYVSPMEVDRVYMPFRHTKAEVNTKYLGQILKVINKYVENNVSHYNNALINLLESAKSKFRLK
jgi:hypothetical protein